MPATDSLAVVSGDGQCGCEEIYGGRLIPSGTHDTSAQQCTCLDADL